MWTPMPAILSLVRVVSLAPVALSAAALFAMMLLTFFDVILRSAFDSPIEAATELTRILMAVLVFSALPVVSGRAGHIAVDLTDPLFPPVLARVRDAVISLACGAMLWWPAERVVVLAERARDYGDVTEYLGIPQVYIAWFIAISTYATAVVLLARGVLLIAAPRLLEDPSHD